MGLDIASVTPSRTIHPRLARYRAGSSAHRGREALPRSGRRLQPRRRKLMDWVKQIPAWVWLLLAAWQLPRAVMRLLAVTMMGPGALAGAVGSIALTAIFLVLAL